MLRKLVPLVVYLIGFAITAWYVFGSQYLSYPDAIREYQLYLWMREDGYWAVFNYAHQVDHQYILQASCLFTTYFPAEISRLIPASPELFYKIYIALLLPVLPVVVYLLASKFTGALKAFIAALLIISWISFIDGASTARTGVAITFYALVLLLVFSGSLDKRIRYPALIIAGVCIPLAHYSTAALAVAILAVMLALSFIFRKAGWEYRKPIAVAFISILLAEAIWCYGIQGLNIVSVDPGVTLMAGGSIWSFDLPARAALGMGNPHDFSAMGFTYAVMALGWGTVMLTAWGIYKALRHREYIPEIRALGVISFAVCVLFFLVQPLARVYGVERVYFQALVVLGIFFTYGAREIITLPLVVIFGGVMKAYELIHSIVE